LYSIALTLHLNEESNQRRNHILAQLQFVKVSKNQNPLICLACDLFILISEETLKVLFCSVLLLHKQWTVITDTCDTSEQGGQTHFHHGPQQHHGHPLKGPETLYKLQHIIK